MNKKNIVVKILKFFSKASPNSRQRWAKALSFIMRITMRERGYIVSRNLELAFPELNQEQRQNIFKRHFYLLALSVIDRGLLWYGPASTIINTTPITGLENISKLLEEKKPIILLAPHFLGLDASATRLTLFLRESATMYTKQSDPEFDQIVLEGRGRFNQVHLVSRDSGVRGLLRYLRKGVPVYYLPDMDFGRKGATFVPFFGVPAATIKSTAQIARAWNANLVPIISKLDDKTGKYHIQVLPPIEDFPGTQTDEEATARLNLLIEEWIRPDPAQYYWVHRRYKTMPNPSDPKRYQYKKLFKFKRK